MHSSRSRFYLPFLLSAILLTSAFAASPADTAGRGLTILCVSAHPDDEDGIALASASKLHHVRTYSLFFTRGEGGQNETGTELYDDLGLLRTQETIDAAGILGSQVFFLGFPDFGFSKTAKETFARWGGEDSVLSRLVFFIRALKPDVVITNHDTITTMPYRQHGNHQAAGISVYNAFERAADPKYHPEQFSKPGVTPWQVRKLFVRASARDSLVPTVRINPEEKDPTGVTMREYALRALACHRSQGLDKIVGRLRNEPAVPRRYILMRSDKAYAFDSTDLFSSLSPHALQPPAVVSEQRTPPKLLSVRISPDKGVQLLPEERGEKTIRRDIIMIFTNRADHPIRLSLRATIGQRRRVSTPLTVPPGESRDTLRVALDAEDAPADSHEERRVTFAVIPNDTAVGKGKITATYTLVSVHAAEPGKVLIGLVQSYDNTTEEILRMFHIPFRLLDSAALASEDLSKYSSIILDLRCYAFRQDAEKYNSRLLEYVNRGGNILCLYHKPGDWNGHGWAPYPIELTQQRVTEEDADVTVRQPSHPFFTTPNQMLDQDWDNWIQERNIYLPADDTTRTSPRYERLLGMSDEGETEPPTSLLWCTYGKGTYTYTSLALYRQLRNLNEGAVKLFFNLIAQPGHSS